MGKANEAQIARRMRENGFTLHRTTNHGSLWTDGISMIMTSRGASQSPRTEKRRLVDLKRALAKRAEMGTEVQMETRESKRIIIPTNAPLKTSMGDLLKAHQPPAPEPKRVDMGARMKGYDPVVKDKIEMRLLELFELGGTHVQITDQMNKEGFKNIDGNPFSVPMTSQWLSRLGLKRHLKKEAAVQPAPAPVVPLPKPPKPEPMPQAASARCTRPHVSDDMLRILRDTDLTDAKKVKLILAYLE